jgi:large subunit ribosomal protein L6
MSRIGKQPITIPTGTSVAINGDIVTVKGPKGELSRTFRPEVAVAVADNIITTKPQQEDPFALALWGTYASHLANMVHGVNHGYEKQLIVEGVGYRAQVNGNQLTLSLGYSHPVVIDIPAGIEVVVEKNTITIRGINKDEIGQFAALVRSKREPEPYKGKGIRYSDEVIRRKEGKKSA